MIFLIIIASLCIGSFLNVVIYRLPQMLEIEWKGEKPPFSLFLPCSHCDHCYKPLRWFHNIPVVSFVFLKGCCAYCSKKISWTYPLVEIVSVLVTVFLYQHFQLTLPFLVSAVFSYIILALIFIDLKHQLLPDVLTLLLLWIGLFVNSQSIFVKPSDAIIGAMIGYLFLWSIAAIYQVITKREGMGYGDYKLLAAIGAWVGWQGLLSVVLIASLSGTIVGVILLLLKKVGARTPIAFGPFLAIAGSIVLVWGGGILHWIV